MYIFLSLQAGVYPLLGGVSHMGRVSHQGGVSHLYECIKKLNIVS